VSSPGTLLNIHPGNGLAMSNVGRFGTMLPVLYCVEPPYDNTDVLRLRVERVVDAV
jgi:hypothetical protein